MPLRYLRRRFFSGSGSLATALAAVMLTGVLALRVQPAEAAEPVSPSLTITGRGEVTAVPDVVRFTIGVATEARTAGEALAENSKAVSAVVAEAEALGIDKRKISTARLLVQPVYASRKVNGREVQEVSGYAVTNALSLEISPVAKAGSVIDRLVGKGANTIDSIAFEVSDADARLDEARTSAVKAARARAELYAAAAGVRLGRVLEIRETSREMPMPRMRPMASKAAAPPIEAGEATLGAEVDVTFEILQGSSP
ncbi:SIMPL domain-containing protein [Prosthecomicrobium sp. N25]|uniref:SIMPL domain-containing protein n=1 Tax=Prosthecomicrobium sp. N25 TaxID=3129254 RepID=UPI0030775745